MRFLLRITALLMLPPMLMSCASYEFGEYPLTQSEISYFSRVDPSAAIVTDLGGNTFDVENPTIHAVFTDFLASWAGRQAYISFDRFTDIAFNQPAPHPRGHTPKSQDGSIIGEIGKTTIRAYGGIYNVNRLNPV
jgi:hypothetical protein